MIKELEKYKPENIDMSAKLKNVKFWSAEMYSIGKYLRKYAFYPRFLPLCVYTDHGVGDFGDVALHELNSDAPVQFYHSLRKVENFRKLSKKPCFQIYSPQIFYRQSGKIKKLPTAKGTLAFPAHTTNEIENDFDRIKYINDLKSLPEEFQPVSICLHIADINKNEHEIYLEHGFNVYTAGNNCDERFIEKFYDILRHFKYSTSNIVGSYSCYSVEMGIPFFIYGERENFINHNDHNLSKGEYDLMKQPKYKEIYDSFKVNIENRPINITEEQIKYTIQGTGLDTGLSRIKLCAILYYALISYHIKYFIDTIILRKSKATRQPSYKTFLNSIKDKNIYFYGAGLFAEKLIAKNNLKEFNIKGFIDGNIQKKGKYIGEYEIFHINQIKALSPDIIFLCLAEPDLVYYELLASIFNSDLNTNVIPYFFQQNYNEA